MSRNEIILGVVALVLVGFSLVVSLYVPRRRPDFPGERIGLFVGIAVLLVVAMLAAVEVFGEEEESEAEPAAETQPAEQPSTGGTETGGGAETGGTETGGAPAGDPAQGKELFASSGCGSCHTLEDAGTSGNVGPNLDDLKPSFDAAVEQITNGGGPMPAYGDQLSEEEIQSIAAYIVQATQ